MYLKVTYNLPADYHSQNKSRNFQGNQNWLDKFLNNFLSQRNISLIKHYFVRSDPNLLWSMLPVLEQQNQSQPVWRSFPNGSSNSQLPPVICAFYELDYDNLASNNRSRNGNNPLASASPPPANTQIFTMATLQLQDHQYDTNLLIPSHRQTRTEAVIDPNEK